MVECVCAKSRDKIGPAITAAEESPGGLALRCLLVACAFGADVITYLLHRCWWGSD